MPQNISLRVPYPVRLRHILTGIMVFIFMATNPVMAKAYTHVPPDMRTGTQKYSKLIRFFPVRKLRTERLDLERFKENCAPNLNGRSEASAEALKMIAVVNQERMEAGLTKLEMDTTLMKLAGEKCWDMVRFNYFGHNSKQLGTIYDQLDRVQFQYQKAAENIIGASSLTRAIQTVFSSPAHRSNILNPRFRKIGIGIIKGGAYGKIIVQIITG